MRAMIWPPSSPVWIALNCCGWRRGDPAGVTRSQRNCSAQRDRGTYVRTNAHTYTNTHIDPNPNPKAYTDSYANTYPHAAPNSQTYPNPNSNARHHKRHQ